MPHFTLEFTDNIKQEANIPELLKKANDILISFKDVFPIGGIRSRAIEHSIYRIADGACDDAFVHAQLKIGSGRPEEIKKKVCETIFEMLKDHFSDLMDRRYMALSLEIIEFSESGTYKHNTIHRRFK